MGAGYAFLPIKQVDLLPLKVASESCAKWATSVPILVFLGLSVLNLGQMYATDRQTDVRRQTSDAHHRLMPPPYGGGGIIMHRCCTRWLDKNRFWQTRSDRPLHEQYHMGHVIPLLDRLLYDVLLEFNPCLNQLLPKLKQKISMNTCSNVDWSHTNERIDSSFN